MCSLLGVALILLGVLAFILLFRIAGAFLVLGGLILGVVGLILLLIGRSKGKEVTPPPSGN